MDQAAKIVAAARVAGKKQGDIAEVLGMSKQSFSQKLQRGTFRDYEMEQIAVFLGAKYVARFEFPDGTRI